MRAPLRLATLTDVDAISQLHLACFPATLTSFLGSEFLKSYYRAVIRSRHGIAVVATDHGAVIGFAVGSTRPAELYAQIYSSRVRLAAQVFVPLMRRPYLALRLARAFLGTRQRRAAADCTAGELSSLAVSVSHRRRRLGEVLVQAFCWEAAQGGVSQVLVRTPLEGNESVLAFYRSLNFRVTDRLAEGRNRTSVILTSSEIPSCPTPEHARPIR